MNQKVLWVLHLLIFLSLTNLSFSLPAPKYLSIPQWKSCVRTVTKDGAEFICLPSKKPGSCPRKSWKMLTLGKMINVCG